MHQSFYTECIVGDDGAGIGDHHVYSQHELVYIVFYQLWFNLNV
jgi:hypothetical protein